MEINWRECELGDLIELKRGYDLPKSKRTKGKVPIISSSGASGEHNEVKIKGPGVVTGRYGTIGKVFYVEEDYWPLNTTLYVKDFKGNDPLFINYLLQTISFSDYTDKGAVPGINRNHVHKAKVKAPNCPKIQKVLGGEIFQFEKKMKLNQETNQTIEQLAQAIFKSWFVDFDPVFDNALASGIAINDFPEALQKKAEQRIQVQQQIANGELEAKSLPEDISQLFPSEFEQSIEPSIGINGWLPKGWQGSTIHDMVDTISDTYKLKEVDEVIFLNTGDIENGKFLHSDYSPTEGLPGQAKKSIAKGDILYSEIRPKNKRFAFVTFDSGDYVVSTKLMVLRAKGDISPLLPYFILTQDKIVNELQHVAEHRSGTFPQITFKELQKIQMVFPKSPEIQEYFVEQHLKPIFNKRLASIEQNEQLEKLRDTLLPKLISGELTIPTAKDCA